MGLQQELNLLRPFESREHEAVLNIVYTGMLLEKAGYAILQPLGLTDTQFNVLMLLGYQSDTTGMTQTELGNRLLVNRSNITGVVDRMEKSGWVERRADSDDRRINKIRLTPAGRKMLKSAEKVYFPLIHTIMSTITTDAQKSLSRILEQIRSHLRNSVR